MFVLKSPRFFTPKYGEKKRAAISKLTYIWTSVESSLYCLCSSITRSKKCNNRPWRTDWFFVGSTVKFFGLTMTFSLLAVCIKALIMVGYHVSKLWYMAALMYKSFDTWQGLVFTSYPECHGKIFWTGNPSRQCNGQPGKGSFCKKANSDHNNKDAFFCPKTKEST